MPRQGPEPPKAAPPKTQNLQRLETPGTRTKAKPLLHQKEEEAKAAEGGEAKPAEGEAKK